MITELTLCEVGVGPAWEGKDYVSFLSLAAYGLVHSPKGQIFIRILTLSLHNECSRSTQTLSKQRMLSFHVRFSLVENLGGLAGLIISVRFQVGKSISGVFYGREGEQRVWWHLMWFTHLKPSRLMWAQPFLCDNKLRWEGSWSLFLVPFSEGILFFEGDQLWIFVCCLFLCISPNQPASDVPIVIFCHFNTTKGVKGFGLLTYVSSEFKIRELTGSGRVNMCWHQSLYCWSCERQILILVKAPHSWPWEK